MNDQVILLNALLAKIYYILTKSDDQVSREKQKQVNTSSTQPFVSFISPGIPVKTFDFVNPTSIGQLAEAAAFSHVFNMIPSPSSLWSPTNRRIWDIYD